LVFGVMMAMAVATSASAQPQTIGTFQDWSAYTDQSSGSRICYIGAKPKKAEGDYSKRGEIFTLVSHRPSENVVGEVSIEIGYPFKKNSEATATVDGKPFKLFTRGENAWAYDAAGDRALVSAMKAGTTMEVKGVSSRGTNTTDTYSLSGFTAAFNAISKACDVR
jgi:invasion protein IalB